MKCGDMNSARKSYASAEVDYKNVLKSQVRQFGTGAIELSPVLSKLGSTALKQGNYHDADNYLSQVVKMTERHYGAQDARTLQAKQQLYTVLDQAAGQFRELNRPDDVHAIEQRMQALKPSDAPVVTPAATPAATPEVTSESPKAGEAQQK